MTTLIPSTQDFQSLRGLYSDLHRFGVELQEVAGQFQHLVGQGRFPERGAGFSHRPGDPEDVLNRSVDITRRFEFLVAVTGAFSSGKSSLLNLLLEQDSLLPSSVIPMTAVCTAIRYGDQPRAEVRYVAREECYQRVEEFFKPALKRPIRTASDLRAAAEDPAEFVEGADGQGSLQRFAALLARYGEITTLPVEFATRSPFISGGGVIHRADGEVRYFSPTPNEHQQYLAQGGDPDRWVTKEWLALIRDVNLWVPARILQNDIVLLDLPGLNCREDYHRRAIREYCNMADCVVVTAFQPGNQADTDVLASFKRLSANYKDKVFFVFNKVDQFTQEPKELVRAVDYLARDTIGSDFPRDRFFLASAHLARASSRDAEGWGEDLSRLQRALSGVQGGLPGLDTWVQQVVAESDPGGVRAIREQLFRFLVEDAYPLKVAEIVANHRAILDSLRDAAGPTLQEAAQSDPTEVLRRSVLEYGREVHGAMDQAIDGFRYHYLRGQEGTGTPSLRSDLGRILEAAHVEIQRMIKAWFEGPILAAPVLEDPIHDFDLLKIADDATQSLRGEFQQLILGSVHGQICTVFDRHLDAAGVPHHIDNLFRGARDTGGRLREMLAGFRDTMLHSQKGLVRTRLYHMPRGRSLKRLERSVPLGEMKSLLVDVFTDFYPSWIYENVYSELLERLGLALYLDAEDLQQSVGMFFNEHESVLTGPAVTEHVQLPDGDGGARDAMASWRLCGRIQELLDQGEALRGKAASMGAAV